MLFSSPHWGFLFALVAMTMTATLIVVVPLLLATAGQRTAFDLRRLAIPALGALAISAAAGLLYMRTGTPELATAAAPAPHALGAMGTGGAANGEAGSMEAVAERLAERLKNNPGDVDGWRLLAQSYDVLDRSDAAADAWRHVPGGRPADSDATAVGAALSPPVAARALPKDNEIAALAALARSRPQDADAWATLAQAYRLNRRFPEAVDAYAHAARVGKIGADIWADYADALAANSGGKLTGRAETAIAKALAQEPGHPKALWLRGSAEVEKRDYRAALQTWQRLASRMPPGSPDLRAIEANIAEARTALGESSTAAPTSVSATARIIGTVTLAPSLRERVRPDDTLFVVAKSETGGPPYAVLRRRAADLPLQFELDDSMAMLPGRGLSTAGSVLVEARVSRSGNAMPQSGDLRATSTRVEVAKAPRIALTLAELVP